MTKPGWHKESQLRIVCAKKTLTGFDYVLLKATLNKQREIFKRDGKVWMGKHLINKIIAKLGKRDIHE